VQKCMWEWPELHAMVLEARGKSRLRWW
jgi:hypothetical protein